jgi:hypothetical protein
MNALAKRYTVEQEAFARLKKQAESKVARWRYWETPDWYWEPEYQVKYWSGEAERAPKSTASYAYGYDDKDRVIIIHHYAIGQPRKIEGMDFLRYVGNKILVSQFIPEAVQDQKGMNIENDFKYGGVLSDVFEATVSGGHIARVEHWMPDHPQWDWKTIAWKRDRVSVVTHGMRGRKAHWQVTYDKDGEVLKELDLSKPSKRKPLPKGVTMQSLAKDIRERLTRTVVATVMKAKVKQHVYCLALNYDCEGNPLLPPELGIGLESERQARLKKGGPDAKFDIWMPEEFSLFANERTALQFKDKLLDRACELFNQELAYKDSDEPARKLILQVAADLAKVDWTGKLNATDDFIVYAVDTYCNDLRKNLKSSVPAKLLAKLKKAKLL